VKPEYDRAVTGFEGFAQGVARHDSLALTPIVVLTVGNSLTLGVTTCNGYLRARDAANTASGDVRQVGPDEPSH